MNTKTITIDFNKPKSTPPPSKGKKPAPLVYKDLLIRIRVIARPPAP